MSRTALICDSICDSILITMNETVTKCHSLKMLSPDGKMRLTDAVDTETMQSIPSPKVEPFKLWLTQVGYERLEEAAESWLNKS